MSSFRVAALASSFLLTCAASALPLDEVPLKSWAAPPYWTPSAAETSATPGGTRSSRTALATSTPLPFVGINPCRQHDSRNPVDPLLQNTPQTVTLVGAPCGIPAAAQAVAVNITIFNITGGSSNGVFSVGTTSPPTTAWINYPTTETQRGNAGVVGLTVAGEIVVQVNQVAGFVDFVVDVYGYYAPQGIVNTLNTLSGDVTLSAGTNVTITPSGSTLTIASTGGVALAGSGVALTASHSDHDHMGASWSGPSPLTITSTNPSNPALWGIGSQWGVQGDSSASGPNYAGVVGVTSSAGGNGVLGDGGPGTGVKGMSTGANGVYGTTSSGAASGVYGENNQLNGYGVAGRAPIGRGVFAETTTGTALEAQQTGSDGIGVLAVARGTGIALNAQQVNGGTAGFFFGNVEVQGSLSKASGSFKIDHPLDPENKYLYHSFVESPDMMNIYNGVATTDDRGYATVTLPEWFEALNRDFRYQLTVLDETDGESFVHAKIVRGIALNRFTLRTSEPHARVSWQLTGIRKDAWAESHRIPVEEVKPEGERGRFLHAKEHGRPAEDGIGWSARHDLHSPRPAGQGN